MKHTYIILLILLHLSTISIGMESKKEDLITLFDLQQLNDLQYSDIKKETIPLILGTNQWWYLDKTYINNEPIQSICFNPAEDHLAVGSSRNASIFKVGIQNKIMSFPHGLPVTSICFAPEGQHAATASGSTVCLFDLKTKKQTLCLRYN